MDVHLAHSGACHLFVEMPRGQRMAAMLSSHPAIAACPAAQSRPCYSKAYARASSLLLLTRARHLSLFCSLSSSPCVQNDMPLPWLPEAPAPPLFLPLQSSYACSDLVLPTPPPSARVVPLLRAPHAAVHCGRRLGTH